MVVSWLANPGGQIWENLACLIILGHWRKEESWKRSTLSIFFRAFRPVINSAMNDGSTGSAAATRRASCSNLRRKMFRTARLSVDLAQAYKFAVRSQCWRFNWSSSDDPFASGLVFCCIWVMAFIIERTKTSSTQFCGRLVPVEMYSCSKLNSVTEKMSSVMLANGIWSWGIDTRDLMTVSCNQRSHPNSVAFRLAKK